LDYKFHRKSYLNTIKSFLKDRKKPAGISAGFFKII